MHMSIPAYDTRRGSSLHKSVEGFDEASAIDDRHERMRALAAVRSAGNRGRREEAGAPSAHQTAAILADTLGLLFADPTIHSGVKAQARKALQRAIRYRGFDPSNPTVKRVLVTRMRENPRIVEAEMSERIAREVAQGVERRHSVSFAETVALLDSLRDDDGR